MKKSQLRKIIKEEIQQLLKEETYSFVKPYIKTNTEKDEYFEEGEMYLDIDEMVKIIRDNYESFESSMSQEEFNQYLEQYSIDVLNDVGADEEAYNNISLRDLLTDFKDYVTYS